MGNDAVVRLGGDAHELIGALRSAADALKSVTTQARGAGDTAKASGAGWGSMFGAIAGGVTIAGGALMVLNGLVGGIKAVAGAFMGAVTGAVAMNASLESTTLQFQTLMGDADAAKDHVKFLFEFAKKTPFETGPIIEASKHLEVMGGAALNTEKNLTLVGDAAAATQKPIEEIAFWSGRAYAAIQAGKPFGEAAARLSEMGVISPKVRDELEKLQKSGASGSEVFAKYQAALGRFSGAMDLQANTWAGLNSTLSDTVSILGATALAPVFEFAKGGLKAIVDLLGSDGIAGAARNVGKTFADVFKIAREALAPLGTVILEIIGGLGDAADSTATYEFIVRNLSKAIAFVVYIGGELLIWIATQIEQYYKLRAAVSGLQLIFAEVGAAATLHARDIAYALAGITPGPAGDALMAWGDRLANSLNAQKARIKEVRAEVEHYTEKQASAAGATRTLGEGLQAAALKIVAQADAYKFVGVEVEASTKKQRAGLTGVGTDLDATGGKVSRFAKTATKEIGDLAKEWAKQPAAIRGNAESIGILVAEYGKLRAGVTDKSKLPAELERLYQAHEADTAATIAWARAVADAAVAATVAIPLITEMSARTRASAIAFPGGKLPFAETINNTKIVAKLGTETIKQFTEDSLKADRAAKQLADEGFRQILGALTELGDFQGGGLLKWVGNVAHAMQGAHTASQNFSTGMAQLKSGDTVAGLGSIATGAVGTWKALNQATDSGNKAKDALGGMAVGLKAGAAFGPWGMAVGAAAGAVFGFVKSLSAGRRAVEDFAKSQGGFDSLRQRLLLLGDAGDKMWVTLTQGTPKGDKKAAAAAIKTIEDALAKADAEVGKFNNDLADMFEDVKGAGRTLPLAMLPFIDQLEKAGRLTKENAASLRAMTEENGASFGQLQDAAKSLGIEISTLGPTFAQQQLVAQATPVIQSIQMLIDNGADLNAVLAGAKDEINAIVLDSLKFGTEIPGNMRPWIEALAASGELLDANGNKITDVSGMKFGENIKSDLDDVVDKLQEMIDLMAKGITGAIDSASSGFGRQKQVIDDWAGHARGRAREVEDAITGVAEGHSPSGIKQIIVRFKESMTAAAAFEREAVADMRRVEAAVNAIGGPDLGLVGKRGIETGIAGEMGAIKAARDAVAAAREAGGTTIHQEFKATVLDANGLEAAVEDSILPMMLDGLERGRRGSLTRARDLIGG